MPRLVKVAATVSVDDGMAFDPASVTTEEIRKDAGYAGARVLLTGELARARCRVQVDIGFGDAITPGPVDAAYPVLLDDLPAPRLRTYPVYTVVSEKLHAIALLGMANSRLKDYFDLAILLGRETLDAEILASAEVADHSTASRYGRITLATRQILAKRQRSSADAFCCARASLRASSATSSPSLLRCLKQSATVLAAL